MAHTPEDTIGTDLAVTTTPTPDAPKWLVLTLQILAYAIPLGFLAYVLYINYLPFGYNKTFTIDVGAEGDTDSSQQFYLEPSPDLSEPKTAPDGTTYRELKGNTSIVFNPKVALDGAQITMNVNGDGIEVIPPVIKFNPSTVQWNYEWNFAEGKTPGTLNFAQITNVPTSTLIFNGSNNFEVSSTSNKFEDGAFTIFIEWRPTKDDSDFQQIVGHYNWELLQNKDNISFQVGRTDSMTGEFFSVAYPISKDFFNQTHSAIAVYEPDKFGGYIELYVDGKFAERTSLSGSKIFKDYGNKNLSFGKSYHGGSNFFSGLIYQFSFKEENITSEFKNDINFIANDMPKVIFSVQSNETSKLINISLTASK